MYGNFAGRDASRGMAKQSFDTGNQFFHPASARLTTHHPEMLTPIDQPLDKLTDLQSDEMCDSLPANLIMELMVPILILV